MIPMAVRPSGSRFVSFADSSNLAREALSAFDCTGTGSEELLYGCISKTLESGTAEQAANILFRLLTKFNFDPPTDISLPTLLRQACSKDLRFEH
jgi:hypothetical protein